MKQKLRKQGNVKHNKLDLSTCVYYSRKAVRHYRHHDVWKKISSYKGMPTVHQQKVQNIRAFKYVSIFKG